MSISAQNRLSSNPEADRTRYQHTHHNILLKSVYDAIRNAERVADTRQVQIFERIRQIEAELLATCAKQFRDTQINEDPHQETISPYCNQVIEAPSEDATSWDPVGNDQTTRSTKAAGTSPLLDSSNCGPSCGCNCHTMANWTRPSILSVFLACFAAGNPKSPQRTLTCNEAVCRRRSMRYAYSYGLPQWLANHRQLIIILNYSTLRGPELCLRVPRVRHTRSKIFQAARAGDLLAVRQCLADGTASVIDMDPNGTTALQVRHTDHTSFTLLKFPQLAVTTVELDVVQLLLIEGADPFHENNNGMLVSLHLSPRRD